MPEISLKSRPQLSETPPSTGSSTRPRGLGAFRERAQTAKRVYRPVPRWRRPWGTCIRRLSEHVSGEDSDDAAARPPASLRSSFP
jgi:hypothetical protein